MKKYIILKFTDSNIYLYNSKTKNIIIEKIITKYKIIQNTKIIDIEQFINILEKTIKKYKLNNLLLKNKIYILIPSYYNKTDIFLLNYTFKNLNYYKYYFIKENTLYDYLLNENNIIIDLWDNYGEKTFYIENQIVTIPIDKKDINITEKQLIINNTEQKKHLKNKNVIYLEYKKMPLFQMTIDNIEKDLI